jgi:Ca2+-binding EF-hand superfamily protein
MPLSNDKLKSLLEAAEKDKDGRLNFEEFKKAYMKTI